MCRVVTPAGLQSRLTSVGKQVRRATEMVIYPKWSGMVDVGD